VFSTLISDAGGKLTSYFSAGTGSALIYDANYQPKSTYYAVQQALKDGKNSGSKFHGIKL
jgi:hypothetical protein